MKNIIMIAGIGLLLVGVNIAGTFMIVSNSSKEAAVATNPDGTPVEDENAEPEEKKEAIYFTVYPAFVVNIMGVGGKSKFMQTDLSVMAHDQEYIDAFELHMPAIRSALILLFAGCEYDDLSTPEGKEELRLSALKTVQESMEKLYGKPAIEDLFFTKLVIQ